MLFISLLATLFAVTLAARHNKEDHPTGNKCAKQLAGIVYQPQTVWSNYLKSISYELAMWSDLPPSVQTAAIQSFQKKYGVSVVVTDAMGEVTNYGTITVPNVLGSLPYRYFSDIAQSVMNLGAFSNDNSYFRYSFLSWSDNGVVNTITVIRQNN